METERQGLVSQVVSMRWFSEDRQRPRCSRRKLQLIAVGSGIAVAFAMLYLRFGAVQRLKRDMKIQTPSPIAADGDQISKLDGSDNELFLENLQDRSWKHLGNEANGFERVNVKYKARRKRNFEDLETVRRDYCGDLKSGKWKKADEQLEVEYRGNTTEFAMYDSVLYNREKLAAYGPHIPSRNTRTYHVNRYLCEGKHPRIPDAKIRVERFGPFTTSGGYDWNTVYKAKDVFRFQKSISEKTIYVLGSLFAAVDHNGAFMGYPPIHVHHFHLFPYERAYRKLSIMSPDVMYGFFDNTEHNVISQAHGDAICKNDEGGFSCLLEQLPDGLGYRVINSTSFELDMQINDVRSPRASISDVYTDVALIYTEANKTAATFFQIGNPIVGPGWSTYAYPLYPHLNLMYFHVTNYLLGPGVLNDFILHTHFSSFDSLYAFKGIAALKVLEEYRSKHDQVLPMIFDCFDMESSADSMKAKILKLLMETEDVELFCEVTKPSLFKYCDSNSECIYRDKRADLHCRRDVRLGVNETIVVLAFNRPRNTSTVPIHRNSSMNRLAIISPFGLGYSASQHSILRANFVSDRATSGKLGPSTGDAKRDVELQNYAPPSWFSFTGFPYGRKKHSEEVNAIIKGCSSRFSYRIPLPWDIEGLQ